MSRNALPRLESFLDSALPGSADVTLIPLAGDGSTRRFYRFQYGGRRWVLSQTSASVASTPREHRWERTVHDFLTARGIDVPHLKATDPDAGLLLMEDLGDEHLCDVVTSQIGIREQEPRDFDTVERYYRRALEYLVRIQTAPALPTESGIGGGTGGGASLDRTTVGDIDADRTTVGDTVDDTDAHRATADDIVGPHPNYDHDYIVRYEAGYFFQELARHVYHADTPWDAIKDECGLLAETALTGLDRRVLMHRDYQSRNLMLANTDRLVVIDYQGARPGPPEYDLASLLFDPYVDLPPALRNRLVSFYRDRLHERQHATQQQPHQQAPTHRSSSLDQVQAAERVWRLRFQASAANRLMQALGAFAKLGCRMERQGFREHIPTGLRLLEEVLAVRDDTPALLDLVHALRRLRPPVS